MSAEETGKVPSALARPTLRKGWTHMDEVSDYILGLNLYIDGLESSLRAAEKRAEDAEEREKQAYEGRKCSEEAAVFEANRLREALAASQADFDSERSRSVDMGKQLAASQALTQRRLVTLRMVQQELFNCSCDEHDGCIYIADVKKIVAAALAESPDHVAPAPEGPLPGCTFIGGAAEEYARQLDEHIANGSWAAQEATASPAPEIELHPSEAMYPKCPAAPPEATASPAPEVESCYEPGETRDCDCGASRWNAIPSLEEGNPMPHALNCPDAPNEAPPSPSSE